MRLQNRLHPLTLLPVLLIGLATLAPSVLEAARTPSAKEQMEFGVKMARRGLWSEALFRFQQADGMQPNDARTLNNLAVAYEAVGQFDLALEHYQKALRAAPSNRDLKKNYSRFVEFYQGFKPEGEEEGEESAEGASSEDEPDGDAGQA